MWRLISTLEFIVVPTLRATAIAPVSDLTVNVCYRSLLAGRPAACEQGRCYCCAGRLLTSWSSHKCRLLVSEHGTNTNRVICYCYTGSLTPWRPTVSVAGKCSATSGNDSKWHLAVSSKHSLIFLHLLLSQFSHSVSVQNALVVDEKSGFSWQISVNCLDQLEGFTGGCSWEGLQSFTLS